MPAKKLTAVAGLAALGLLVPVAPAQAQAPGLGLLPAAVTPLANPQMANSCGVDATLVLDASGSIESSNAVGKVRTAARSFLNALKDTKSTARVTQFASFSGELAPRTTVDAATMAPGGTLSGATDKYYNPKPPRPTGSTIYSYRGGSWTNPNNYSVSNTSNQYTNWDQGMNDARVGAPEIVVFVTDGDPSAFDLSEPTDPHFGSGSNVAVNTSGGDAEAVTLDRAVEEANKAKQNGSRVMVVGVGPSVTQPGSASVKRMEKLSGPQVVQDSQLASITSINQIDVALVANFDNLAAFLRQVVSELCTPSVTVRKLAQTPGSTQFTPAAGWDITATPTVSGGFDWILPDTTPGASKTDATDAQGYAQFQWEPKVSNVTSTANISEKVKATHTAGRAGAGNDWVCQLRTPDSGDVQTVAGEFTPGAGSASFNIDVGPRNIVTCDLYNSFTYSPGIHLEKAAADDPVRGNASGWDEVYTFTVTNPGNAPLAGITLVDPKCDSTPVLTGGDTNADGRLDPSETWTYTCTTHIQRATTTAAITFDNEAAVSGVAPNQVVVTDKANESVVVKTPAINIVKSAIDANGDPIADGGTVLAGSVVTYGYTVTNTGNDTLKTVTVTDDRCSPVTYVSGDTNSNNLLETIETWVYNCQERLTPPSTVSSVTNTGTAKGYWSNPQDRLQNNGPVTDEDKFTVNLSRAANLRIIKSTTPARAEQDFGFTVAGDGVSTPDQSFDLNTAASATRNIVLDGPAAGGSQYTITEAGVSGWDLLGITCTKTPDATDLASGEVVVTIAPGEDVTCTYTNGRLPSLSVRKQTSPSGASEVFEFTTSRPVPLSPLVPAAFDLSDGQSQDWDGVPPGSVSITEAAPPAGWHFDQVTCSKPPTSQVGATVAVDLAYGDMVECLYTNSELLPATLTVVKSGTTDRTSPDFSFTASGTGLVDPGQPGSDNFTLAVGDTKSYSVRPGAAGNQYTVTEGTIPTPDPGQSAWELTSIECVLDSDPNNPIAGNPATGAVAVTLVPGDNATCTFTNEQLPKLTIDKSVVVGTGQTGADTEFEFTPTGLTPSSVFTLGNGDSQVFPSVAVNSPFTVAETPQVGWVLTQLQCTGDGLAAITVDRASGELSGSLDYGDDVVCSYVNTKEPSAAAVLAITKATDPASDTTTDFSFTATGADLDEAFTLGNRELKEFTVNPPEIGGYQYTVTEAAQAGWVRTVIVCRVSSDPDTPITGDLTTGAVSLTLFPGDVAICGYHNQQLATLTITKATDVATSTLFGFTASPVNPATFELGRGQSRRFTRIPANTAVTVTEAIPTSAPDRWDLQDIECSGNATPATTDLVTGQLQVSVGAGEDIECIFTNAQVPTATLEVVKAAQPADGTDFSFTAVGADGGVSPADQAFTLTPDGGTDDRLLTLHPAAAGEVVTLTETAIPAGWNLDDIVCRDGDQPIGTPDIPAGMVELTVQPAASITCTFFDRADASLTVVKSAPDDPTQAFDFSWSPGITPSSFQLSHSGSRTATGLAPGVYTVDEGPLPADWYLSGPDGEHPICLGASGGVVNSPLFGATLTLAAGDTAVCGFADFYDYRPAIQLVKSATPDTVIVGGNASYSYLLTNTGNVDLPIPNPPGDRSALVTDDLCSPVEYVPGGDIGNDFVLAQGETWEYSCAVSGLQQDTLNTATATVPDPTDPNTPLTAVDTAEVKVLVPAIEVVKSVDSALVYSGDEVNYRYEVTNTGQVDLDMGDPGSSVTDDRCSPVNYVSGDPGSGILAPGRTWTYECGPQTIDTDTTNVVTAVGVPTLQGQTGAPVSDTDTAQVGVLIPDITLAKVATSAAGQVLGGVLHVPSGSPVTYTYTVTTGTANTPMAVLNITDDKCAPVTYQSGDTNGSDLIDPGESWTYTCITTVEGVQVVTNTAVVVASEPILGGVATATDTEDVVSYESGLALTKSASAAVVQPGTPVTYTFEVRNTGDTLLSNVVVADDKCTPVTYVSGDANADDKLAPSEVWLFTCTAVIDVVTTNTATVTGTDPFGTVLTDTDQAIVRVVGVAGFTAGIAVVKVPSATTIPAGGSVTYTYDVTNTGNLALANVASLVSDDRCAPVTYVSGDTDGNGLLTSGTETDESGGAEVWQFKCTTTLNVTTTNTVTVGGTPTYGGRPVGANVTAAARATVVVTSGGGGGGGGNSCGSDGAGSDCGGFGPMVPMKVSAKSNKYKVTAKKWVKVVNSASSKKGNLTDKIICRNAAGKQVTGCSLRVGKGHSVKVKISSCKIRSATVTIKATPKASYAGQYRSNFWTRTWKSKGC